LYVFICLQFDPEVKFVRQIGHNDATVWTMTISEANE